MFQRFQSELLPALCFGFSLLQQENKQMEEVELAVFSSSKAFSVYTCVFQQVVPI